VVYINDLEEINISNMIYEIRGKQVMLDSDLAKLYHCKNGTKEVNQAVKNNIDKFPERFSWILSSSELNMLRSKFLTTNISNMSRSNPRVFTEQGVAMLATIIKSKIATQVSIRIMDAFVSMRHYLFNNMIEQKYINNLVLENNDKIKEYDNSIKLLQELFDNKRLEDELYFDKEWDAYSKLIDIFSSAKNELIIVDRYTDKSILDIICRLNVKVILITSVKTKISKLDIDKYNSTYNNMIIYYDDSFHDRYFILDRDIIYHSGNSINHIGYRKSSIDIIGDDFIKNLIISDIEKIIC
jgi:sugar-specific transcriptional regulator TrmB